MRRNKPKRLTYNDSSTTEAQESKKFEYRSKSGLDEQNTQDFAKEEVGTLRVKSARSKCKRNKTQEKLHPFKQKVLPEFILMSDFNPRKSLEKAQQLSKE